MEHRKEPIRFKWGRLFIFAKLCIPKSPSSKSYNTLLIFFIPGLSMSANSSKFTKLTTYQLMQMILSFVCTSHCWMSVSHGWTAFPLSLYRTIYLLIKRTNQPQFYYKLILKNHLILLLNLWEGKKKPSNKVNCTVLRIYRQEKEKKTIWNAPLRPLDEDF